MPLCLICISDVHCCCIYLFIYSASIVLHKEILTLYITMMIKGTLRDKLPREEIKSLIP